MTITGGPVSPIMAAIRSGGSDGSSGTQTPPACRIASTITGKSSERSRQMPTSVPMPTPRRRRCPAQVLLRLASSPYVSQWSS